MKTFPVDEQSQKLYDWEKENLPHFALHTKLTDEEIGELISGVWGFFTTKNRPAPRWKYSEEDQNGCYADRETHTIIFARNWNGIVPYYVVHEVCHLIVDTGGHNPQFLGVLLEAYCCFFGMSEPAILRDWQSLGFSVDSDWQNKTVIEWSIKNED